MILSDVVQLYNSSDDPVINIPFTFYITSHHTMDSSSILMLPLKPRLHFHVKHYIQSRKSHIRKVFAKRGGTWRYVQQQRNCCGSVDIRPRTLNREVPGSNLLAAGSSALGQGILSSLAISSPSGRT